MKAKTFAELSTEANPYFSVEARREFSRERTRPRVQRLAPSPIAENLQSVGATSRWLGSWRGRREQHAMRVRSPETSQVAPFFMANLCLILPFSP